MLLFDPLQAADTAALYPRGRSASWLQLRRRSASLLAPALQQLSPPQHAVRAAALVAAAAVQAARVAAVLAVQAPVLSTHLVAPAVLAVRASVVGMPNGPSFPQAQAAAAALARVQAAAVPPAVPLAALVARHQVLLGAVELEACLWASFQARAASLRLPAFPLPPLQLQPVLQRALQRRRCLLAEAWATEALQAAA